MSAVQRRLTGREGSPQPPKPERQHGRRRQLRRPGLRPHCVCQGEGMAAAAWGRGGRRRAYGAPRHVEAPPEGPGSPSAQGVDQPPGRGAWTRPDRGRPGGPGLRRRARPGTLPDRPDSRRPGPGPGSRGASSVRRRAAGPGEGGGGSASSRAAALRSAGPGMEWEQRPAQSGVDKPKEPLPHGGWAPRGVQAAAVPSGFLRRTGMLRCWATGVRVPVRLGADGGRALPARRPQSPVGAPAFVFVKGRA